MKFEELQKRPTEDLAGLSTQLRRELWQARFTNHTNQLKDNATIRRIRRDIARVNTLVTQRQTTPTQSTGKQS